MTTPVPPGYRVSWSHSSLSTFETCPRKYWHEKIAKDTTDTVHPATARGLEVHKALEDLGKKGTPLPQGMEKYKPHADMIHTLAARGTEVFFENKMATTRGGQACDFDGPEAYGRAIADVMIVYVPEKTIAIIDSKTGQYRGKTNQPVINAYTAFALHPEVEVVRTIFDYINVGKRDLGVFARKDMGFDFQPVAELIQQLENAVAYANFPAKRNGLCRNFCGALGCPHNGRYRASRVNPGDVL